VTAPELITRTVPAEITAGGDGRTVTIRLLGWADRPTDETGSVESFHRDAFTGVDPERVRLRWGHLTEPVGRGVAGSLAADELGPVLEFRVSKMSRGNDLLEAIADKLATAASVEFVPITATRTRGGIEHRRVDLRAVAVVDESMTPPAYPSARVLAVRTETDRNGETAMPETAELETRTTTPDPAPAPEPAPSPEPPEAVAELESRLARLEARTVPPRPAAAPVDPVRLFHANLRAAVLGDHDLLTRVLADVTGTVGGPTTDASGLVPEYWWTAGLTEIAGWRPLFDSLGSVPFPPGGGVAWPVITQHTSVGFGVAQKADAPTRALRVIAQHATPAYAKGAVDVAMELVDSSNPAALEVVWRDLVGQYMAATEVHATGILTNNATATGAVLPDPGVDYGAFRAAVRAASMQIRVATGRPGDQLALPPAEYAVVADATGTDGRPMFPALGPTNVDGTSNLTDEAVGIGGVRAFYAPAATVPLIYNGTAAIGAERGPTRVQANNVAEMGVDVGIIGPVYVITHVPAGVLKFATAVGRSKSSE
jgi:phage head maturation protease